MKATGMKAPLKQGLKRSSLPGHDKSGFITSKGKSIDSAPVRKETAPTPRTLGPRTA